jgi:hypothetical protein
MPAAAVPNMLEAALALATRGFSVFPVHTPRAHGGCSCARADCDRIGKHPRTPNGLKAATQAEATIREWWRKWPDANIGILTGHGLIVLDVDVHKDGTSNGLDLPDTLRAVTGSGGEHWYMRADGDCANSVELVGPGLDVRADGGYVLAPPSLHACGKRYEWDAGGAETVAAAPDWFLKLARQRRVTVSEGAAAPDAFVAGGRNDAMASLAGAMRRKGMSERGILAALLEENAARCRPPLDEAEVRRTAHSVARYTASDPVNATEWQVLGWSALSTKLPPLSWLCRELGIAPGAPTLVAGYGFSGKTVALQSLAVAVASGQPAWGRFQVEQGKVLHVDYEQGRHLTQLRYQRLAISAGVWDELSALELVTLPPVHLDADGAVDKLGALCDGRKLCIIDSLKAAFPSAEENSADVRKWLDQLTRVSEATGCTIAVIHHARKPQKDSVGGPRMAIRGSGAIYDACGTVLVFDGAQKPTIVSHDKARILGVTVPDFALEVSDHPWPVEGLDPAVAAITAVDGIANETGSLRSGLVVRAADPAPEVKALDVARTLGERIVFEVRRSPGCGVRALRLAIGGGHKQFDDAIGLLVEDGRLRVEKGAKRALRYFLPDDPGSDDDGY